jgi:hypothetical protein
LYGIVLAQGFVLKNLLFLENGFDGVKCSVFKVLGFALRGVASFLVISLESFDVIDGYLEGMYIEAKEWPRYMVEGVA